ncbi:uncharacterized protein LOC105420650 isoform X3 [Amborella trichopoda]|uniref:uncharacterized protein LOC105420650 isoform X3 n=1 Tax=Amborella trichopoda TaxID=13333 RepID=UPI0005D3A67C|nr:uncharacterized protein LOC105420650 isoform X3 [Amborella trichopoda]|eukprot:XP_011623365.1 uncharacterized protein LOC105420650 isoform X3 [Amborella trichopoda]
MGISRVLNCLCFSNGASSMCLCLGSENIEGDGEERRGLIQNNRGHVMRIRDIISEERDRLAFQLMPQMVILRVSLHCKGCAKQVGKHISKIEDSMIRGRF